jgi:hypothetical protein
MKWHPFPVQITTSHFEKSNFKLGPIITWFHYVMLFIISSTIFFCYVQVAHANTCYSLSYVMAWRLAHPFIYSSHGSQHCLEFTQISNNIIILDNNLSDNIIISDNKSWYCLKFDGYAKVRESLHTWVIISVNIILNHIGTRAIFG